jgi:predicted O-methyltransferase YrrM
MGGIYPLPEATNRGSGRTTRSVTIDANHPAGMVRRCETAPMSIGGTASYGRPAGVEVPALVRAAVAAAEVLGFEFCVRPETGRLLATLAAGLPPGSLVGETGTGTGAGLAWMVAAADSRVRFVSFEREGKRAEAAREVLAGRPNVEVVCGDSAAMFSRGPFDLLVHDGGPGSGKIPGSQPVDPVDVLRPGGTMTIDDYTPTNSWPPTFDGEVDESRLHWLAHPVLTSTEVRVAPDLAVIVCRYLPALS